MNLKTPSQIRADLYREGISLAELCRRKNLPYQIAKELLNGKLKGKYGSAHHTARALGMK